MTAFAGVWRDSKTEFEFAQHICSGNQSEMRTVKWERQPFVNIKKQCWKS